MNAAATYVMQAGYHALRSAWGACLAVLLFVWILDHGSVLGVVRGAAFSLAGTAPYFAIAVLLIALLKATGAEGQIAAVFAGREARMIVMAALFGGLAPFCSAEVIPFIAALLAAGAPLSAIMAFWLSSPLVDPSNTLITAGALGWGFAIGKAIAAVAIGLLGGFAVCAATHFGMFRNPVRKDFSSLSVGCCGASSPLSARPLAAFWREKKRREIFLGAAWENGLFLLKWLSLAYLIEALLVRYVPANIVGSFLGGEGIWPILVGAAVGIPAYLNGYASPPLVAGLIEQGMTPGAGMAFMVAGAVSCIPAMVAVWSLVTRTVFAAYAGLGFLGAVLSGLVFQFAYA